MGLKMVWVGVRPEGASQGGNGEDVRERERERERERDGAENGPDVS